MGNAGRYAVVTAAASSSQHINGVSCPLPCEEQGREKTKTMETIQPLLRTMRATRGIGMGAVGTTTTTRITPSGCLLFSPDVCCGGPAYPFAKEYVSYEEVRRAFLDCAKRKRNTGSCLKYELEYEQYNLGLWRELNSGTYKVGASNCFLVTVPKLREVFASSFRDRVVHHLIANRFLPIFESEFIDNTFSCRKGKGVFYGVKQMAEQTAKCGKDAWVLKIDLSGFFMSINRDILFCKLEKVIQEKYKGVNIDWWLSLIREVVFDRPEQHCKKRGSEDLWSELPKHKSLFYSEGRGLPIGNLTSQLFANLYLSDFDKWASSLVMGYGRYVDDVILIDTDKTKLLKLLPIIRMELSKIGLAINEEKTSFQRADKGFSFIGYIIKPWGLYSGARTKQNAIRMARTIEPIEKHLPRLNSYLGFMRHTLSYGIRWKIWNITMSQYKGLYGASHLNYIKKCKYELQNNLPSR